MLTIILSLGSLILTTELVRAVIWGYDCDDNVRN